MDAEGFKSLLWILLWGGFFVWMMRSGCGAHVMGGRGHHGSHASGSDSVKDPVCGMTVEPARAAGAAVHAGTTYYFCSSTCRDKFEQGPERYLAATAGAAEPAKGDGHG